MNSACWTILAQEQDKLGESAMWRPSEQAIYWVDWYGPTLHRLRLGGQVESWTFSQVTTLGSLVFATGGRLILALDTGIKIFDPAGGELHHYADPNQAREGLAYNDSKLDRQGRLWAGTFDVDEKEPRGILYCLERDGRITIADSGYVVCNGPAFSPDGRILYFSDTVGRRIIAYDLDPEEPRLTNRRLFSELSGNPGLPDGLTVDAEGYVWCALYGAGQVIRFAPDGQIRQTLTLPAANVTSCAFGGPSMTTLFVTSGADVASVDSNGRPGEAGALFALELDIQGLPENEFNPDRD